MGDPSAFPSTTSAFEQRPVFEPMPVIEHPKPAIALGVLMIVWGLVIFASGLFLLSLGGVFHVLILGPATLISGIELIRGKRWAMVSYFIGILVMLVWLVAEGRGAVAIVSFLFAALIGVLVTKRRWPILAGGLMVFSSLAFIGAMLLGILVMMPDRIAWRTYQPPVGNFTLQMPAETIARDPIVQHVAGYTLTKHPYEAKVRGQGSAGYIVVEYSPALPALDTSGYERFLEAELDNLVKNTNSTLISKQPLACHGYPGLSFELKPPSNPSGRPTPRIVGRIFMNADYLYVMQIVASDSSELMANSIKFLDPVPLHQADGPQAQR